MADPAPKGLFCPSCRGVRLAVRSSARPAPGIKIRYRQCSACGHKFTTREVVNRPRSGASEPRS